MSASDGDHEWHPRVILAILVKTVLYEVQLSMEVEIQLFAVQYQARVGDVWVADNLKLAIKVWNGIDGIFVWVVAGTIRSPCLDTKIGIETFCWRFWGQFVVYPPSEHLGGITLVGVPSSPVFPVVPPFPWLERVPAM